jgi:ATP-dependent exoDNAse (exonuclease V) beta subunit
MNLTPESGFRLPRDREARIEALDISRSFAVAAPAGSGKTGLLTQRILCLLAVVDTPEHILCMTFTRKAAGEMRHRLVNALIRAEDDTPPTDDYEHSTWLLARDVLANDKAKNWQLIAAPNRLNILTIDSFCRNLASQLVLESGFSQSAEPVDNPDKFYRMAIYNLFGELETDTPLGKALGDLLIHFDNDMTRLVSLLLRLLSKREQWLPHILSNRHGDDETVRKQIEQAAGHLIEETLDDAARLFTPRSSNIAVLADYAALQLLNASIENPLTQCQGLTDLPTASVEGLPQWLGLAELLLTKSNNWRKTVNKKVGFPTKKDSLYPEIAEQRKAAWVDIIEWCQQQSGLLEILADIRYLPAPSFEEKQWQILSALIQILPQLSGLLSLVFREQAVCDYTEVTLAALTALGDEDIPTDLTLRLDTQINHILVDEFQDTSSIHFDILRRLTTGWQSSDGRTLFFVGDAMQSLYGFRNANVGLFMDVRRHSMGEIKLQPLDLNVNFRSQANIISWINRLFSGSFPALPNTGRGAVPYEPSKPFLAPLDGPAVKIDIFDEDSDRLLEAEQVAQIILASRVREPASSIAILVRGRAHLRQIIPALREHRLPWKATDIDPLATCMHIVDLMSLTRAMINPADRIPWLSILRAPWCGLGLDDLLHVATAKFQKNPVPAGESYPLLLQQLLAYDFDENAAASPISEDGIKIIRPTAATLASAWQQRFRKPLRIWLEGIWIDLGGPAVLPDEQSLAQCRQYWDLLEDYARDTPDIGNWPDFEDAVDQLYAENTATTKILNPGETIPGRVSVVQIMTIHKAKGLEFDTVILPGLDRRTGSIDAELLLWRERVAGNGRTELLLSAPQQPGSDKDQNYEHLKREETLKNRLESARVLYVACTRAAKYLHLLFNKPIKEPGRNSLLGTLWPTLQQELEEPGSECEVKYHSSGEALSVEEPTPLTQKALRPADNIGGALSDNRVISTNNIQWRLPPDWQRQPHTYKTISNDRSLADLSEGFNDTNSQILYPERDDLNFDDEDARKTGILFHRTLRSLVHEGTKLWDASRVANQHQVWQQQTGEIGIIYPDEAINTMAIALKNCLNDTTNTWIFDDALEDSACELALGYLDQTGIARTSVVDRTFIINGERWIIDYKLNKWVPDRDDFQRHTSDQPRIDFLAQQKKIYTPQLRHYAKLFGHISELPTKTALYFPLFSHLEMIPT